MFDIKCLEKKDIFVFRKLFNLTFSLFKLEN
jgi:hypothetical protein